MKRLGKGLFVFLLSLFMVFQMVSVSGVLADEENSATPQDGDVVESDNTETTTDEEQTTIEENKEEVTKRQEETPIVEEQTVATQELVTQLEADALTAQNVRDYFTDASGTIVNSVNITYTDPSGAKLDEPRIDSQINFTFGIAIPDNIAAQINSGDYYDITLPDNINIATGINNVELYDNEGVLYGVFSVGTDNIVHIVFTDEVHNTTGVNGSLFFQGGFDPNSFTGPGDYEITIPEGDGFTVPLTMKPKPGGTIDKAGALDQPVAANNVTWTVNINKSMDKLTGVSVKETLPTSVQYDGVKVYKSTLDLYGNVVGTTLVEPDSGVYTVDDEGNVTFNDEINDAYQLVYVTPILDSSKTPLGGSLTMTNTATLSSNEHEDLNAKATVTAQFNKLIEKVNTGYVSKDQRFHWNIRYNYGGLTIPAGQAVINDIFDDDTTDDKPMAFDESTLVVRKVTFSPTGTPILGEVLTNYTLDTSDDGRFEIKFNDDVDYAVNITYDTKVPDGFTVTDDYSVTNTAITGGVPPTITHSTGNVKQQLINKSLVQADVSNKILSWKTILNANEYPLTSRYYQDFFGTRQTIIEDSIVVKDLTDSSILKENDDYVLVIVEDNDDDDRGPFFAISFMDTYPQNHSFEITYQTDYKSDPTPETGVFDNTAYFTWNSDGTPGESHDYASYKPTTSDVLNGSKSGSYNAVTKEITWSVLVDYANTGFKNAYIEDPIISPEQGQQKFVANSVRIYKYTLSGNLGIPIKGEELSDAEYANLIIDEASETNGNVLTIHLPDGEGKYWVEYRTSVQGENVASKYNNTATLHNDLSVPHDLKAEVDVKHGGKLVEKSGEQGSDGYAWWTVNINPSQSMMDHLTIVDTPSANQTVQLDSLKIYPTIVSESGNIKQDLANPLVVNEDYKVVYQKGDDGLLHLVVTMVDVPTDRAYIMSYKAAILLSGNDPVTNTVMVNDDEVDGMDGKTNTTITIHTTNAGGILVGERTSLIIRKTGLNGVELEGAKFQLYDRNGNSVGTPVITDANGEIIFNNLIKGNYYIKELEAAPGYVISDELYDGVLISVNQVDQLEEVTNEQTRVVLTKYGRDKAKLEGAEFTLQKQEANNSWSTLYTDLTTESDGTLEVDGLVEGTYQFVETKAPSGYVRLEKPKVFTVEKGSDGRIPPVINVEFQNYQGSVKLKKVDARAENPIGLEGGVFRIDSMIGPYQETVTSDVEGEVEFSNLAPGVYYIREMEAPEGFELNEGVLEVTIPESVATQDDLVIDEGNFVNGYYLGTIDIYKMSEDEVGLGGAQFSLKRVADENGNAVSDTVRSEITTNKAGQAVVSGLPLGSYEIWETKAPEGYILNTEIREFEIESIDPGISIPIQLDPFVNYQQSVEFMKTDTNGTGLADAEFTLTKLGTDPQTIGTYLSDSDGKVSISNLAPGNYELEETKAPSGYVINSNKVTFIVNDFAPGKPDVKTLSDIVNGQGSATFKKTSEDGGTLEGVVFELSKLDDSSFASVEYTTDENGTILMDQLIPGKYQVVEKEVIDGYILNTQPFTFEIKASASGLPETLKLDDVVNYKGSVQLQKVDNDGTPLADAKFTLESVGEANKEIGSYTTDSKGIIEVKDLNPGTYQFVETKAPYGFLLDETPIMFTIEAEASGKPEMVEVSAVNEKYLASLKINKEGSEGNRLANAQFKLTDEDGDIVKENIITGKDGSVTVSNLEAGTYYVKETKAPDGYQIESKEYKVEITYRMTTKEEDTDVIEITVVNKPLDEVTTGDTHNSMFFYGLGLVSLSVVILIARKQKHKA